MTCPNCKGTDYKLVEVEGGYQKAECFECGVSGPMVPLNGKISDELAYEKFHKISFETDKLMEALGKSDPWKYTSGLDSICKICGSHYHLFFDPKSKDHHHDHNDCIWLKAWLFVQEKEGKNGTNPG